jgi:hypothetical protein
MLINGWILFHLKEMLPDELMFAWKISLLIALLEGIHFPRDKVYWFLLILQVSVQ